MLLVLLILSIPALYSLPPEVVSDPPYLTVSADQQLIINCSHSQSDAVFWTDSSGTILDSEYFNSTNQLTASHIIISANRSLNGSTFQCVANLTNSTQISLEVTIQVLFIANSSFYIRQSDVRIGETIFLSCYPDSWPPGSINWTHSGASLGSTNQLSVPVTSSAVAGEYTCIATNSEGSVMSSAVVTVIIDQSDFLLYRNESSAVSMVCNGTDLSWNKSDTILTPSALPSGLSLELTPYSSTLLISSLTSSLADNYSCYLDTPGIINSNFQIIIPNLENTFTLSPPSRQIFPTESVDLPCSPPSGDPIPLLLWYRSGMSSPLSNTSVTGINILDNGFLHINSFSQSDVGVYTCVAYNLAGFILVSADLSILPSPIATILLADTPAVSHIVFIDVIILTCNISINGQVLYSWYKSDQLIGDMNQLEVTSSGEYSCFVEIATSSSSITVQSDSIFLAMNDTLAFDGKIGNQLINEGDTLVVTCDTIGGTNPSYLWFYGNEEIKNSTNNIVWNNQLTIIQATQENAGEYKCFSFSQSDFEAIKQTFTVIVRFGPIIMTPYKSVTLYEGIRGSVECDADGSPPPIVSWRQINSSQLLDTLADGTLIIPEIKLSSAGTYECTATDPTNQNNSISVLVQIIVLSSSPLFPYPPTPTLVYVLVPICITLCATILLASCVVCVALMARRSCSKHRSLDLRNQEDSPNRLRGKLSPKYQPLVSSQQTSAPSQPENQKPDLKFPLIGFPRDELSFGTRLGDGAYGPIIEGTIEEFLGKRRHVAVECYISKSDEGSFPKPDELHTWPVFFLYHDNLSRVLGICTSVEPYYVIYEYSDRGCLKEFLRNYKEQIGTNSLSRTPSKSQSGVDANLLLTQDLLLRMCSQAALGLEFLAQNDMVFRDVASRNCCVSSSLDIKLINLPIGPNLFPGDYYKRDNEFVPVRWMSPESLQNSQFTTKSDVWAFGVFCWEVFTFSRQPYELLSDDLVLDRVPHGLRLDEPEEGCPEGAYKLMTQCWNQNPDKRPSFSNLCVNLNDVTCD
ncbi:Inactive tyrosine-protein kinase 7 [Oopsacas minuta]|uniref:Tyrosine-protein kinase-like otk n=1 Tax=Oopsacas minuta TaxID=111878 RepID=A0AAV7JLB0_9METZ|nr:Inactive tyrosine-protein kinase 7 [Oopsacas minuta]